MGVCGFFSYVMDEVKLIANSGIQIVTFPVTINLQDRFKMWYHEWYNTQNGEWILDAVYELQTDNECFFYNKQKLFNGGYFSDATYEISVNDLKEDGIFPLRIDDEMYNNVSGDIYSLTFADKDNTLSSFENVWLPVPYFFRRTPKRFKFGPLNWARIKLIPIKEEKGKKFYNVLLAIDTRARYENDEYDECPVFPDRFKIDMDFELCNNEFYLMDYCSLGKKWSYIDDYLRHLAHPGVQRVAQIRGANVKRMAYIASYTFLVSYFASKELFPKIKLYKDTDVEVKDVDMVVDIGNSRTTALLIEDNRNFNQVRKLRLIDYTNLIKEENDTYIINSYDEPFDMRLAFRKVDFGDFGIKDSKQFVYPSLVRLGQEANTLIHYATNSIDEEESLSTYSSPKRYLWDWSPNKEEWKFLVLEGESDSHILNLRGITNQLKSDGKIDLEGKSGSSFHYSRRSLMTFSFLEMLIQAKIQINGEEHRSNQYGLGKPSMPRRIRRIIVTCPTAMSKIEREALVRCAKDAVILLENFEYANPADNLRPGSTVDVIPAVRSMRDADGTWYYDEATCSQLVYMYGEVGHKYKGCCSEFFNLYGKVEECPHCNGTGHIRSRKQFGVGMFSESITTCSHCGGTGKLVKDACSNCNGSGLIDCKENFNIKVPTIDKVLTQAYRHRGSGHSCQNGLGVNGDLNITFSIINEDGYEISNGLDIIKTVEVPLIDCLLGTSLKFVHLDGKTYSVNIKECSKDGALYKISGKGFRYNNQYRGDLYVKVKMVMPTKLDEEDKKILNNLKKSKTFKKNGI